MDAVSVAFGLVFQPYVLVVILLALFLVLDVKPVTAISVAVVGSLLVHFAFYKLLRVPLPWGVLQGVAW